MSPVVNPSDLQPQSEMIGDLAIEARKSAERAKLKAEYDRWRAEPFTERFLSYFNACADMHRDMCVHPEVTDRDIHAHFHQAYSKVAGMSDTIYMRCDSDIERRYEQEIRERDREFYDAGFKGGETDVRPSGDDGSGAAGF